MMQSHSDIMSLWDTAAAMAADIACEHEQERMAVRARKWKARGRIPARYWPKVAEAAQRRGHDVTVDLLARLQE